MSIDTSSTTSTMAVADAIFDNKFAGLCVVKRGFGEDDCMQYWGEFAEVNEVFDTEDLLEHGDGRCEAWSDLFLHTLKIHGINTIHSQVIFPNFFAPQNFWRFYVKNCEFILNPNGTIDDHVNLPGIPAQGNEIPTVRFVDHSVLVLIEDSKTPAEIVVNTHTTAIATLYRLDKDQLLRIYDPSYGLKFSEEAQESAGQAPVALNAHENWEHNTVQAYESSNGIIYLNNYTSTNTILGYLIEH